MFYFMKKCKKYVEERRILMKLFKFNKKTVRIYSMLFILSFALLGCQQQQAKPQQQGGDQTEEKIEHLEQKINTLTNKLNGQTDIATLPQPQVQDPRMQLLDPRNLTANIDPSLIAINQRAKEKLLSDKIKTISGVAEVGTIIDRDRIFVALMLSEEFNAMQVENIKNQAKSMIIRNNPDLLKQYIITEPAIAKEVMQLTVKLEQGVPVSNLVQQLDSVENELYHKELEEERMEIALTSDIRPEKLVKSLKDTVEGLQDAAVVLYNNTAYVAIRSGEKPKSDQSIMMEQKAKDHVRKQALFLRDVKVTDNIELFQTLKDMMAEKDIGKLKTAIEEVDYKLLRGEGL